MTLRRRPRLPTDLSPTAMLPAGLSALNIATWEAVGSSKNLRARLGDEGPAEFQACAGRELNWIQRVVREDRQKVQTWLETLSTSRRALPLDYRITTKPGTVCWIRHTAQSTAALASPGSQRRRRPTWSGLVQLIDDQKQWQTESLQTMEAERFALGQELHDNTCQVLAGLACLTQAFTKSRTQLSAHEFKPLLADLNQQLLNALERVRARSHTLVTAPAFSHGLAKALQTLVRQSHVLYDVKIELQLPSRLPRHREIHVVQLHGILTESISNAVKHGAATKILVVLRKTSTGHTLEIRDNGRGFSTKNRGQGIGLHLMRHRAALIGASMTIENQAPTGTRVRVNYSVA